MTGKHTVPVPGWECAACQPSCLFAQPGYVPGSIFYGYTYDRDFDSKRWDFQRNIAYARVDFARHLAQVSDYAWGKTSVWQCKPVISGSTSAGSDLQSGNCGIIKGSVCNRVGCN